MNGKMVLPQAVKQEIQLYLGDGETVIEAIPSTTGSVGKLGELWMILTDRNVLFYTCEYGKDPVVALIARTDLQNIVYEPHPVGVTLTFIARTRPQHPTRIAFLKAQSPLVNGFCAELAKTVEFEVIAVDEKSGIQDDKDKKPAAKVPEPSAGTKPADKPADKPVAKPLPIPVVEPVLMKPPVVAASPLPREYFSTSNLPPVTPRVIESRPVPAPQPPGKVSTGIVPPERPAGARDSVKISRPSGMPASSYSGAPADGNVWSPDLRYVLVSTGLAFVVGFIWYRLFRAISDARS